MSTQSESLVARLDPLRPLFKRTAITDFDPQHLFSSCLKSSFVKTFEFVELSARTDAAHAYFLVPALRSMVEDVILFGFLSLHPHDDRELVILNLMHLKLEEQVKNQHHFFRTFRPFQPVLPLYKVDRALLKSELRSFWNRNGWPHLRVEMPQVRQIAEKWNQGLLKVVYDFIYRLTSESVHSNPRMLLRQGWGNAPAASGIQPNVTFRSGNLGPYHLNVCQIYGTYMLCLYLESFADDIVLSQEEQAACAELREFLWAVPRWPEAITFEEMNFTSPEYPTKRSILVQAMYGTIMKTEGLTTGTNILLNSE